MAKWLVMQELAMVAEDRSYQASLVTLIDLKMVRTLMTEDLLNLNLSSWRTGLKFDSVNKKQRMNIQMNILIQLLTKNVPKSHVW